MIRIPARAVLLGLVLVAGVLPFSQGCTPTGGGSDEIAVDADTLTRRQRDSIVSTLPIPGARAVGRALEAADLAADRALAHDTLH